MSLEGLAEKVTGTPNLRDRLLKDGGLIVWPCEKTVGIAANLEAQRLNAELLTLIADMWCPQYDSPTMIPVDMAKDEALTANS